ncbi:phosphoribosyltransferase-like protein [Aliarcobacter butzleri]|uniref:phosphoribosyltransferase-like protein n=1 Tax=Aliarcobacter butzleri TaxID=28197 RepID=UPI001EDC51F3|nr:hypothetical protein [Aliarcobacter butzleri]MCG3709106.1 hypothetical protein [Aliarcobacter butzleri]
MQVYLDKIKEIVYDYHRPLTDESILLWINQFDEDDRIFLLNEVINILERTYISESSSESILNEFIDYLSQSYLQIDIEELFNNITFINYQGSQKSQSILLNKLNDLLYITYRRQISYNDYSKKYLLYIDDNLSSGGTFKKDIIELITNVTPAQFVSEDKQIISFFFFLHTFGFSNSKFSLELEYPGILGNRIHSIYLNEIQNNPRINYYNPSPIFNHAYAKDENNPRVHDYLNNLEITRPYTMANRVFAFRPNNLPVTETFFTSAEARDRYERIILNKGLDIIDTIGTCSSSTRPLGFTPPSHQTLGLGSHVFTWRNTSNTCPIVYWWERNGWHPLLPVQNRGQN